MHLIVTTHTVLKQIFILIMITSFGSSTCAYYRMSGEDSLAKAVTFAPRGSPLPLNSKKITIANLHLLARGLGLPTTAAPADDRRQVG